MKDEKVIVNIDTANEEIERLSAKLGIKPKGFVPKINKANEEIERLEGLLAAKAAPTHPSPKVTDTHRVPPTATEPEVTGLQRAINANLRGSKQSTRPVKKFEGTGLQRAINANIEAQKK